ncbi:pyruvate decarboxylase 1-like [Salvia hispanica]|uniref:pyruvate decarboxylase 1-like n=1 Tax=Salvia hispanica TaxID=49212 RepID=UPI0020098E40|nr:pyruvate decarboxylase 1-like [Salvia hispanica]
MEMETKTVQSNSIKSAACNGVVPAEATLGQHLARRLVQIGVSDVFSVPGDYNMALLDYLVAEPGLNLIGCCNELNAGYAADGYARARGVAACAVTFTVGGLSILNAIAGAYSGSLPVICIVGGPSSNDYGSNRILHHTIGLPDFSQELRCFQTVTCYQAVVNNLENARELIDTAISSALKESKPVYISVSCNLPGIVHPSYTPHPLPLSTFPKESNQTSLESAVKAAVSFLNKALKPVMVGGPKLRAANASNTFLKLADACGYPVAVMPSAKGLIPEYHPHFIGTYWGVASTPFCAETVKSADAYLFVGPIFDDINTVCYSLLLKKAKTILVEPDRVVIGDDGTTFDCVRMKDFLSALTGMVRHNATGYENYSRMYVEDGRPQNSEANEALRVNVLFQHIQKMLCGEMAVVAETGDSWFNCQKLKLPSGCGYEVQIEYGSIGWSVGATLGYAQAAPEKRVVACIGDGSFQMTANEVSTMLTCGQNNLIFLINNGGYTTEEVIHEGPYNVIKNWNYTGLVDAICNDQGKCWTTKAGCEEELIEAIDGAMGAYKSCLCFIEVILHKDDTSKELLQMGTRFSAANSRPPNST